MVLSKEDRVALLAKAREAKARKKTVIKEEVEDEPEPEPEPAINLNLPDPEPEPPTPKKKTGRKPVELPVKPVVIHIEEEEPPKKKAIPNPKWLKQPKTEVEKVCCKEPLTKEEPVIKDDEPISVKQTVVPSKSIIKKPKTIRASTRTLEIVAEPKPLEEVFEEVKNNEVKYLPVKRPVIATPPKVLPAISQPISIRYADPPLQLFSY
jgi:hypothetical protein